MRTLLATASLAVLAACATTETAATTTESAPSSTLPNAFSLAMETADGLVQDGNEQAAIDRLTQLLGNPNLSDEETAKTLMTRGDLRRGNGNDVWGAISDYEELLDRFPSSPLAGDAQRWLDISRGEATSLNGALEMGGLSPLEEFQYRFRLGEHQHAVDLMFENNLRPDNSYVVDLYQIGYLCDDPTLTGPSYEMTEPDSTVRTVRFCEFGK